MKEKAFRFGYVIKQEMTVYACCRLIPKDNSIFDYIEVEYEDGSHHFFFENEEGHDHFERNFVSKRFTSYHEFFTTEELAIEKRGSLELKYYVRRDDDCYEKVNLKDKAAKLAEMASKGLVTQLPDRITEYGVYDTSVNNHF